MDDIARLERSQLFLRGTDGSRPLWFSYRHQSLVHLWPRPRQHEGGPFAPRLAYGRNWMATRASGGAFVVEVLKAVGGPENLPGALRRHIATLGPKCAEGVEWHGWDVPAVDNVFLGFDGSMRLEIPATKTTAPPRGGPDSNMREAHRDWREERRREADYARRAFHRSLSRDTVPASRIRYIPIAELLKDVFPERLKATRDFIAAAHDRPPPPHSDMAPRCFLDFFGVDYFDDEHPPPPPSKTPAEQAARLRRGHAAEHAVNATFQHLGEVERRDRFGATLRDRVPEVVDAFSLALRLPLAAHEPRWFETFRAVRLERRARWRAKRAPDADEALDVLDLTDAQAETVLDAAAPGEGAVGGRSVFAPVHVGPLVDDAPPVLSPHQLGRMSHVPPVAAVVEAAISGDADATISQWMHRGYFGLVAALRTVTDDLPPDAARAYWRSLWVEMDDSLTPQERAAGLPARFEATFLPATPTPVRPPVQRHSPLKRREPPEAEANVIVTDADLRDLDALSIYPAHRLGAPAGFAGSPAPTPQQMVAFNQAVRRPVPLSGHPGWTTLIIKQPGGTGTSLRVTFEVDTGLLRATSHAVDCLWTPDGKLTAHARTHETITTAPAPSANPALTDAQIDAFRNVTGYGLPATPGLQSGAFRTQGPRGPDTSVGVTMRLGADVRRLVAVPTAEVQWHMDSAGMLRVTIRPDDETRPPRTSLISPDGRVADAGVSNL